MIQLLYQTTVLKGYDSSHLIKTLFPIPKLRDLPYKNRNLLNLWNSIFLKHAKKNLQIVELSEMPPRGERVTAMFSATFPKEIQVRIKAISFFFFLIYHFSLKKIIFFPDSGSRLPDAELRVPGSRKSRFNLGEHHAEGAFQFFLK